MTKSSYLYNGSFPDPRCPEEDHLDEVVPVRGVGLGGVIQADGRRLVRRHAPLGVGRFPVVGGAAPVVAGVRGHAAAAQREICAEKKEKERKK